MANLTDDPRAYSAKLRHAEIESRGDSEREAPPARIARLAQEVAEAGERLSEVRDAAAKTARMRQEVEAQFAHLSEQLIQAIHEHREGTPANAPYQP